MRTTLTTDPGTTQRSSAPASSRCRSPRAGVTPTSDAARYTFPVTKGKVDGATLAGYIRHSGGLLLAQRAGMGWKALSLAKFGINITGAPNL